MSRGIEVRTHAVNLGVVIGIGASLETGGKAHLHLRIDTARKCGIGMKVVCAAAHLKEVERIVRNLFSQYSRREWAIVFRISAKRPDSGCDRYARVGIIEDEFQHGRE